MKYLPFFLSILLYFSILFLGASTWILAGASTKEQWQQYQAKIQALEEQLQENSTNKLKIPHILRHQKAVKQNWATLLWPKISQTPTDLFSRILERKLDGIHSPGALLYAYRRGQIDSGRILWQRAAARARPTASMGKLMSLLLIFEFLRDFEPEQVQRIPALGAAAERPFDASVAGLRAGLELSWQQLLTYAIVASANDAAYSLAILSEQARTPKKISERQALHAFVARMQKRAVELNLTSANFVDPDGWSEHDLISPADMVRLGVFYIENFPEALSLHRQQSVELVPKIGESRGRIKRNTNILLPIYPQIDGLKTGFTYEAGFNFSATAERGEWRYIVVIMGLQEPNIADGLTRRAAEAEVLLDWGMSHFRPLDLLPSKITPVGLNVEKNLKKVLHSSLAWHAEPSQGLLLRGEPQSHNEQTLALHYQIDEEQLYKKGLYSGFVSVQSGSDILGYLLLDVQPNKSFMEIFFSLRWLLIEPLWPLIRVFFTELRPTELRPTALRPYGLLEFQQK